MSFLKCIYINIYTLISLKCYVFEIRHFIFECDTYLLVTDWYKKIAIYFLSYVEFDKRHNYVGFKGKSAFKQLLYKCHIQVHSLTIISFNIASF